MKNKKQKEISYKAQKCPFCERTLPNSSYLTDKKCLWCDLDYFMKNLVLRK